MKNSKTFINPSFSREIETCYPSCEKLNPGFSLMAARVSWVPETVDARLLLESFRFVAREGGNGGALRGALLTSDTGREKTLG